MKKPQKRSLFPLYLIAGLDNFGFGLVFVMFAPLLLSPQYHFVAPEASLALRSFYLGLLFVSYPLTQFFGAPLLGDIADRMGRRQAFTLTLWGLIGSFILSGVAALTASLSFLIISRLISGFFAGNLSICLSSIADISPSEKERSHNFATLMVVWALSWTVSMVVGGYLSDPEKSILFNPSVPFFLTALLGLIVLRVFKTFYSETHPPKKIETFSFLKAIKDIKEALKIKAIRPFLWIVFLFTVAWGGAIQWFAQYSIDQFKATQIVISWSFFIQGFFWFLGGAVINSHLLRRFTSSPITKIGFVFCTLFLAASPFAATFWVFSLFFWGASTFASFALSNSFNLVSINASADIQGRTMGITQSMSSISWIGVPIIGTFVATTSRWGFYPISAALTLICLIILIRIKR